MASIEKRESVNRKGETTVGYRVRDRDGGKQPSKTFAKLKDAKAYKARIETDKVEGIYRPKLTARTVQQVAEEYLRVMEDRQRDGRISHGRLKNVSVAVRCSVLPYFAKKRIDQITSVEIEDWYAQLVRERRLKPATAKGRALEFKLLCAFAIKRKSLAANPVADALNEIGSVRSAPIRTFTLPQVQALLSAVENRAKWQHARTHRMLQCAVHLAAFCGLRLGEIMGLPRDRVNFQAGVLEIRHSLTPFDVLKGPKTKSGERDVPMPSHVATLLSAWLSDCYVENDRGLVFRGENGRMIMWAAFNVHYWHVLLKRAGLDRKGDQLHFHALRHFAASW